MQNAEVCYVSGGGSDGVQTVGLVTFDSREAGEIFTKIAGGCLWIGYGVPLHLKKKIGVPEVHEDSPGFNLES